MVDASAARPESRPLSQLVSGEHAIDRIATMPWSPRGGDHPEAPRGSIEELSSGALRVAVYAWNIGFRPADLARASDDGADLSSTAAGRRGSTDAVR
jgi:hypothetical protein